CQTRVIQPGGLPDRSAYHQLEELVFTEARCPRRRDIRVRDLRWPRSDLAEQPIQRRGKAGVAERAGSLLRRRSALSVQDAILQGPVGCPLLVFCQHRPVHLLYSSATAASPHKYDDRHTAGYDTLPQQMRPADGTAFSPATRTEGKPETHRTDLFARRGGAERGQQMPVQLDHPGSDQIPHPSTAADPPPALRFAALPGVFRPLRPAPRPGRGRELVFRRWLGGPGTGY